MSMTDTNPKVAATCSHQDSSRGTVSGTAHAVAYARSLEAVLHPQDALFHDPYAAVLAGEVGREWAEKACREQADNPKLVQAAMTFIMPVRTRRIDDSSIVQVLRASPCKQICALGAGLDTRPWRLPLPADEEVDYFELDFPEIFAYKLPLLEKEGAVAACRYHAVQADLSLGDWMDRLTAAGFDSSIPTVWLLEGLSMYLTENENKALFESVAALSAPGSHVITCMLTPTALVGAQLRSIGLLRFTSADPLATLRQWGGWEGTAVDMLDAAKDYQRAPERGDELRGYFLINLHN